MTLQQRLTTVDRRTLERACLHLAALAGEQLDVPFAKDQICRTVLSIALDAGSMDWVEPFDLSEPGLSGAAQETVLRGTLTCMPPNPASEPAASR